MTPEKTIVADMVRPGMMLLGRMDFGGFPFGPTYTVEVIGVFPIDEDTVRIDVWSEEHGSESVICEREEEVQVWKS